MHPSNTIQKALMALFFLPWQAGAAIEARIFELKAPPSTPPLYTYSLIKSREGSTESWDAKINDATQRLYATERTVAQDGKLVRYSLIQPQIGEEAEVKRTAEGVVFRYLKEGKWKEGWEKTSQEVITGPQIVETVLHHWEPLTSGSSYEVRFAVPDRLETIGFRFNLEHKDEKTTVFHFIPSHFFIRQFVDPVVLTFHSATKVLQSIKGPTFLKKKIGEKWHELKAEVRFD